MSHVIGSIINDCADANAQARQELRFSELFGVRPSFLGVGSYGALEAAGNLLDQLDVLEHFPLAGQHDAVVLVNVAPRNEAVKKQWGNGTPFYYFRVGRTLVVGTYEPESLALLRDAGATNSIELLDTPRVTAAAVAWGDLKPPQAVRINNTQFRSLEFLPLVAYWLRQGRPVPSRTQPLDDLPGISPRVWWIDNFGELKTTLLPQAIDFTEGKRVRLASGQEAICYTRLVDVPNGVTALTIGSSGYGAQRFLELVIGGQGDAAAQLGLAIGSPILPRSGAPSVAQVVNNHRNG